ncbi:capsular polysaccharide export protein, LipB/KpsS family, partial [Bordetella pertussis]|uniref:capsular polysaccharide export protein, LipB/KpsS family n=1 Tax=Bordetella pertussis TaxID=520 RepID=UPI003F8BB7FD
PAVALARASGVRVHVFEEGYFRPHWVTLERGGVNGFRAIARTRRMARRASTPPMCGGPCACA